MALMNWIIRWMTGIAKMVLLPLKIAKKIFGQSTHAFRVVIFYLYPHLLTELWFEARILSSLMEIHMRKIFAAITFMACFVLISVLINNLTYSLSKNLNISDDILFISGIFFSLVASFFVTRKIFKKPKTQDDSLGN
jgi:hypothetical protein